QEEQSNLNILRNDLRGQEQQKQSNEKRIKECEEQMEELREQFKEHNALQFDHDSECSCPTCGQDLPEGQIEQAKSTFNKNKSASLERINEKGINLRVKVEEL